MVVYLTLTDVENLERTATLQIEMTKVMVGSEANTSQALYFNTC
jgi:hypothetical protein